MNHTVNSAALTQINLEFGSDAFVEGSKLQNPEKTLRAMRELACIASVPVGAEIGPCEKWGESKKAEEAGWGWGRFPSFLLAMQAMREPTNSNYETSQGTQPRSGDWEAKAYGQRHLCCIVQEVI